jgi:hypothetical protein
LEREEGGELLNLGVPVMSAILAWELNVRVGVLSGEQRAAFWRVPYDGLPSVVVSIDDE